MRACDAGVCNARGCPDGRATGMEGRVRETRCVQARAGAWAGRSCPGRGTQLTWRLLRKGGAHANGWPCRAAPEGWGPQEHKRVHGRLKQRLHGAQQRDLGLYGAGASGARQQRRSAVAALQLRDARPGRGMPVAGSRKQRGTESAGRGAPPAGGPVRQRRTQPVPRPPFQISVPAFLNPSATEVCSEAFPKFSVQLEAMIRPPTVSTTAAASKGATGPILNPSTSTFATWPAERGACKRRWCDVACAEWGRPRAAHPQRGGCGL